MKIPDLFPGRGFESTGSAVLVPRYEDIAQDGRMMLAALLPGLGAVWRALGASERLESFRARGILPILSRIIVVGEDGPFTPHAKIEVSGTWRLAREADGERLFLDMWLEARAPRGSILAAPPAADAERVLVGRAYAEHVITRPFATTPAERKVVRLDLPGIPAIPEDAHPFEDAAALVAGHALSPAGDQHFGMLHTDSNQHVNSLVYPRLFEEAAVRRAMTASERGTVPSPERLLARAMELRYRKPFFAGDRADLALTLAPAGPGRLSALGSFTPPGAAKPSATLAMTLA